MDKKLNDQRKLFAELYAGELYARAVDAYAKAYGIDLEKYPQKRASVQSTSSALLQNLDVLAYIRELRGDYKMTEELVNSEHGFLIIQNSELSVKLGAIKHFRELNNKIETKIQDNTITVNIVTNDNGQTSGVGGKEEGSKEPTKKGDTKTTKGSTKKK